MLQPLQRQRKMRASLVVGNRVNLVNDHGFDGLQDFAALRGGQQDVERFRCGDQNMRGMNQERSPFMRQCIAGANGGTDRRHQHSTLPGQLQNFGQRTLEIFLNVVAQRL